MSSVYMNLQTSITAPTISSHTRCMGYIYIYTSDVWCEAEGVVAPIEHNEVALEKDVAVNLQTT